jgi:hypothetical protein
MFSQPHWRSAIKEELSRMAEDVSRSRLVEKKSLQPQEIEDDAPFRWQME